MTRPSSVARFDVRLFPRRRPGTLDGASGDVWEDANALCAEETLTIGKDDE